MSLLMMRSLAYLHFLIAAQACIVLHTWHAACAVEVCAYVVVLSCLAMTTWSQSACRPAQLKTEADFMCLWCLLLSDTGGGGDHAAGATTVAAEA